jgi:RecJ-like exonuclease
MTTECKECDGTGKIWFSCCGDELNEGMFEGDDCLCPTCNEHCSIDDYDKCTDCDGKGEVQEADMQEEAKTYKDY